MAKFIVVAHLSNLDIIIIIIIRDRIAKEVAKYIVVAHLSNLNNIITIFVSLRLASSASNHTID